MLVTGASNKSRSWKLLLDLFTSADRFSHCLSSSRVHITPRLLTDFVSLSAWRSAGPSLLFHVWYRGNAAGKKNIYLQHLDDKKCKENKAYPIYWEFLDCAERLPAVTFTSSSFLSEYIHKRCHGRKLFCMKTKGLDGTCLSFKICFSEVIVRGKIDLGFTGE